MREVVRGELPGPLVVRDSTGSLHHEVKGVTLRLTPAARRRLARDARLAVRVVVRLRPARKPVVHRLTLVRGRG